MEIGLGQAWHMWFSGEQLTGYTLFGLRVLWWGRIGSVLETVSALTILVEIVGYPRISAFSQRLNASLDKISLKSLVQSWQRWRAAWSRYLNSKWGSDEEKEALKLQQKHFIIDGLNIAAAIATSALLVNWLYGLVHIDIAWYWDVLIYFLIMGPCAAYLSPFLILTIIFSWSLLLRLFDLTIIALFCLLTRQEVIANAVRSISLVLLLVGFHFDLLAS